MRLVVLFLIWCFCTTGLAAENEIQLTTEQAKRLGIRTAKPEQVATLPLAQAPARVVLPPQKEFVVSSPQAGVISNVAVPLGARVKQGEVLARIQSPDLLALQRALLDAVSEFNLAEARLKRDETLLKEGIISRLRWQETKSDYDKAQAALQTAEQTLSASGFGQNEIRRLRADRRLSSVIEVRAPIEGVVLERMAVVGQRVDRLTPMFRVGKLDELWLEVDMPQERLHEVRIGDRVSVENARASARIIEVGQHVDPRSQSALVRAVVDSRAEDLRPGMHINVQLMHKSTDLIFRLPIAALASHEGRDYVFVQIPGGFVAREVAVAGVEQYSVVIHEGLDVGEEVAVQGVAALKAAWLGMGEEE
ncbi:efflux RND transporter periplasmic adaptor subunit [Methylocaldum szegediense]|uniref:Membrane fusion protein, heavy metal efflux system n=1 Tax=Methylocaldum szegediense TaxID=73780 RepID=A0ABN8X5D2_9GAMM|nr:efflux RND transporter periplasmic adaptor subunit [Methylocaldum szegediense]CAI8888414.1 membrane fusion protein, heavy metal efflux system [Methylocaldum szegediense]